MIERNSIIGVIFQPGLVLNVHKVNRSLILPYSSAEMYDLANNVEDYHEFLPWCSCSAALERDEACAIARIDVSYKGMKSSFTTRNELTPNQQIHMTLVEGPFSALEGKWLFDSLDDVACRVSLAVEFAFSTRLIEKTMAPVFTHICGDLIDAFARRAEQVHGERRFA